MNETTYKKLYRSRTDKVFAGICGGLAKHFNIDSTWIRLGFVLMVFMAGLTLLIYLIMWMVVPQEPETPFNQIRRDY